IAGATRPVFRHDPDEMTPRTEEAGHHGANGCPRKIRDLAVRKTAKFAEHERLAVLRRQRCNRGLEYRLLFLHEDGGLRGRVVLFNEVCSLKIFQPSYPPSRPLEVRRIRSRSRRAGVDETRQALAVARATLSATRDAAGEAWSAGDAGGVAGAPVAADRRGLRSWTEQGDQQDQGCTRRFGRESTLHSDGRPARLPVFGGCHGGGPRTRRERTPRNRIRRFTNPRRSRHKVS